MRNRLWLLLAALCISMNSMAAIDAVVNYAVFYTPTPQKTGATVDAYWQINPLKLHYHKNEKGEIYSQVQTDLVYRNAKGIVHEDHYILNTKPVMPGDAAVNQRIMDIQHTNVPFGKLTVELTLSEPGVPGSEFKYSAQIDITDPGTAPAYSSLQLLDTVLQSSTNSPYLKNGRQQIPLGTNFIDDNRKTLNYYTELYNTDKLTAESLPVVQKIYISKKEGGEAIVGMSHFDTLTGKMMMPVNGSFSLVTLTSGNYYLNATLTDQDQQLLASRSTFFQLINKNPVAVPRLLDTATGPIMFINTAKTFVGKFNLVQLKAVLKMLIPISDRLQVNAINNFLRNPDENNMRYFIYNFFATKNEKDPDAAWEEYANKVREVNKRFGTSSRPGYETDRGLVYLRYGKPDDMVSVPNEPGALPYEIWQYYAIGRNRQEGVFLFYQPTNSFGELKLLHSTVIGELKNANWRSLLYSDGNLNENSRAEQYMRGR